LSDRQQYFVVPPAQSPRSIGSMLD